MRKLGLLCLLLVLAIFGFANPQSKNAVRQPEQRPNILLITVDTLRSDHLSSYGYHLKTSPRIDQLASEGVLFENAHAVIPMTGPSHISMFTSRYPQEHGARINGVAMPANSKWLALPQILRRYGYHNAAFVSAWTLNSRLTRLNRWFELYDEDLPRTYQLFNSSRYAEDVTPRAVRWLHENDSKPFFLWVHYFDPHSPYHLREEFASPEKSGHPEKPSAPMNSEMRERIRRYDSEIGYCDHHIGRLLDQLDKSGQGDNTIVVLTSDHGESLGEHGYVGHGRHLYDGIVRVPLIVRYPGKMPAGKVIRENVSLLDITPTLLDLAVSEDERDGQPFSFAGRSLAAAMKGGERVPERPMRYVAFAGRKGSAPRWLSWIWVQKADLPLRVGLTDGPRKLIWSPGESSLSIYDIAADPWEMKPQVFDTGDAAYKRETALLGRWFESTDLEESDATLSERDTEVLKSLGYIQ